ncbi:MAG TPA: hypothetical protein VK543_18440 [Puia sp.]|nr:hypothetical protein [Puia sp.]
MSVNPFTLYLLALLGIAGLTNAQKNIVISDSLTAQAEKLNVKMGGQGLGKMWKMSFGEYAVVSSKSGWTTSSSTGNFFNTKTESKTAQKFSFVLTNQLADSARVNAANNILVQSLQQIELLPHFSWGNNEQVNESRNFTAFITVNRDTSETWALLLHVAKGQDSLGNYDAFLTNGERRIFIVPSSSDKNASNASSPFSLSAAGYIFIENGQSLAALQYRGSGALGMNKNIVWMPRSFEARMKLVLAATMTAIMQLKMTELTN